MEACSYYKNFENENPKTENPETADYIINHPSDFARSNLIYLQEIGKQHILSSNISESKKNASYLFFIVTNGQGKLQYGDVSYVISTGYCAFLNCKKTYRYYPLDGEVSMNYIYFDGFHMEDIYNEFIEKNGLPCFRSYGPKVYIQDWQRIYDLAAGSERMVDTEASGRIVSSSIGREMEIYAALMALITSLVKSGENARIPTHRNSHKRNLQNVKEYLEKNYSEKISLDDLSETFFINKFYLTRLFREQYGTSVNDYLIQIRLEHAKELLTSTKMPVKKVCSACGFANTNYFYKVFRKREGISPGEFQKRSIL